MTKREREELLLRAHRSIHEGESVHGAMREFCLMKSIACSLAVIADVLVEETKDGGAIAALRNLHQT